MEGGVGAYFIPNFCAREREREERDRESEIERNHKKRLNEIEKVKTE